MATTPVSPRGQAGGTILVIGSTGKIGGEFVRQLAAAGAAAAVSTAVEDATGRPARSFDAFAREHAHAFTA